MNVHLKQSYVTHVLNDKRTSAVAIMVILTWMKRVCHRVYLVALFFCCCISQKSKYCLLREKEWQKLFINKSLHIIGIDDEWVKSITLAIVKPLIVFSFYE